MKHFFKAIRLSLRYKWTIMGSIACSFMVALLWGASLSTVFPVFKIVLEGKTAHSWIQNEIDESVAKHAEIETEINELVAKQGAAADAEKTELEHQIDAKKNRLDAEAKALARYQTIQPYVTRYAPKSAFNTLVLAMGWLLGTSILKGILLVLSTILVARIADRTVMDMRRIYYRKALELDQRKIERMGTSLMMTHLSSNMTMISGGLRVFYGKSIREPFKMITCLIGAAMISLPLLMISMIVVPAGALLVQSISRRMKGAMQKEISGMAEVFQTLIETFSWLKTVRIFNRESTERRRFKENAAVLYRMSLRIALYDSLLRPITEVLGIVSIALSILAGSYLVLNQETSIFGIQILDRPMKPSMLVLFYTMLAGASDPARKMTEIVNVLVRGGTACKILFNTYDGKSHVTAPEKPIPVPLYSDRIEFKNVSFHYVPGESVLQDINLTIPFGQTIAIVGGNGSGKSTLMNLIARFYDPQKGMIQIDGKNIRQMNPKKLRRQIAWVTQQSVLFSDTIWENIAYGSRNATADQIRDAAKVARVDEFLDKLNDGFESQVGDNGNLLSAGQRQRVALARAVVANPRILILDEATSQMDGHTESMIHDSLVEFLKGRTTFVVTHRSSSLKLADRVIVMENGQIMHDGPVHEAKQHSSHFQFLFAKSA